MKKFIAIISVFILSLFIAKSQDTNRFVDTNKKDTVTINIIAENKSQVATKDLQTLIAEVNNSKIVDSGTVSGLLTSISSGIESVIKEVEKRNKSDGTLITDKFNYNKEEVKSAIKKQRWIHFITWFTILIYIIAVIQVKGAFRYGDNGKPWPILLIQCLLWTVLGIVYFLIVQNLLTLIFNGKYFVLKELINLYT